MPSKALAKLTWRKAALFSVAVIAVLLFMRGFARYSARKSNETFRRVSVSRQELNVTKTATGEVTPQNRVEVKPPIPGRVEQVLVREGDKVTSGEVLAWMSSTDRAALLDAARSQGPEALSRWESAYKPAPLMAPLDGTVIVRAIEPGQTVTTSDPVVVVADRLIVKAQVDETDIGAIAVGELATISLDAYPQELIPAHIDHVAYEAKTVNSVTIYDVDVLPDHVPAFMRSGMTATVTVTVAAKSDALVVPVEALRRDSSATAVLIPNHRPWARSLRRDVTTGLTDGKRVEILSGLQEGDVVLVPSLRLPRAKREQGSNPFMPFPRGARSASRNRNQ